MSRPKEIGPNTKVGFALTLLHEAGACATARRWIKRTAPDSALSFQYVWDRCERPEWLMFYLEELCDIHPLEPPENAAAHAGNLDEREIRRRVQLGKIEDLDLELYGFHGRNYGNALTRRAAEGVCEMIRSLYPKPPRTKRIQQMSR